jgi:excisionase family DNA binding protein
MRSNKLKDRKGRKMTFEQIQTLMETSKEIPTSGYLRPETFHKCLNEISGLKIGKAKVYEQIHNGKIYALKIGNTYQIPSDELVDYPDRLLAEQKGLPTVHQRLLGNPVKK